MPIGSFLDAFPAAIFISAHVIFLAVGLWAVRKAGAGAFWLYVASQVVFLAFFGGALTMKMAVLIEQTLMVVLVLMVAARK